MKTFTTSLAIAAAAALIQHGAAERKSFVYIGNEHGGMTIAWQEGTNLCAQSSDNSAWIIDASGAHNPCGLGQLGLPGAGILGFTDCDGGKPPTFSSLNHLDPNNPSDGRKNRALGTCTPGWQGDLHNTFSCPPDKNGYVYAVDIAWTCAFDMDSPFYKDDQPHIPVSSRPHRRAEATAAPTTFSTAIAPRHPEPTPEAAPVAIL